MVGELLTWRRLLTRRTLLAPPAAHLILGGGRIVPLPFPGAPYPSCGWRSRLAYSHRRRHTGNGEDSRGDIISFSPRDSLVCVGVAPGCDFRQGFPPPRAGAVAALAAAVIAAAAVLTLYELNREVHIACIGTVASQSESA